MAEMFFVEDGNSAVIDSWISGTKVVADSTDKAVISSISGAGKQKAGLGFAEAPKVPNKSEDVLKQKLQNKRKFDNNSAHLANRGSELHGIVEDVEESRTTIAPTKKQKQADAAVAGSANQAGEKKKGPHNAPPKAKKNNNAGVGDSASKVEKVDNNYFSASNAPASTAAGDASTEGALPVKESFTAMAKKKGKTRSKQKNIRRDNRADSSKPAHLLDARSKDYKGRPLTQETKAILNLKSGKPSGDNNNNNNRQQQPGQRQRQKEKMSKKDGINNDGNNSRDKKKDASNTDSSNASSK